MVVRSLHEVIQQVVDSQGDVSRALYAVERFSHDSGFNAVLLLQSNGVNAASILSVTLVCYVKNGLIFNIISAAIWHNKG